MKQTLKLLLHYLNWHPAVTWLVRAGLVLLAAAFIGSFYSTNFAFGCAIYAYIGAVGLPYLILPWQFRSLIANHRLSQLPGFHLKAGIALLLLTILASLFLPAFTFILGLDALPPRTALSIFIVISGYMGYMQFSLPTPYFGKLSGTLVWALVIASIYYKGPLAIETYVKEYFLVPGVIFVLTGWAYALHRLATRSLFKPAYRFWKNHRSKEPFKRAWATNDRHPQSSTSAGTLLLGVPDGTVPMLQGAVIWVVVLPLTASAAIAFISFMISAAGGENVFPPFFWMFIVFSGFLASFNSLPAGEVAARARLLWLKIGGDRKRQWLHLEKLMLRGQLFIYFVAMGVALLLELSGVFDGRILINYLMYIIVFSLFWLYSSLTSRTLNWPNPVKGILFVISLAVLVKAASVAFRDDEFLTLNAAELGYLVSALGFRYVAKRRFMGIDWYQVQPISLTKIYGQG